MNKNLVIVLAGIAILVAYVGFVLVTPVPAEHDGSGRPNGSGKGGKPASVSGKHGKPTTSTVESTSTK